MTNVRKRVLSSIDALERLVGGLGTALLALGALIWAVTVAVACLSGVGLLLAPGALRAVRSVADRERARLSRQGDPIPTPGPVPVGLGAAVRDPFVRRELGWIALHSIIGLLTGLAGLLLPFNAVQDITFPLWYRLVPPEAGAPGLGWWRIDGLSEALAVGLLGVGWLAAAVGFSPGLARLQAWPGRRLLPPPPGVDLSLRVAELTATRAAALDAHATELRRIERSLHDGTQNRLVAVTVLLGAARRALARDPADADEILGRAQDAAEQALAELRTVVRGILPPVLADRGLAGALAGLAGELRGALPDRRRRARPVRRLGRGDRLLRGGRGADQRRQAQRRRPRRPSRCAAAAAGCCLQRRATTARAARTRHGGSGLTGIRRRVEAHDGDLDLTSPTGGPTTLEVELPCGS